MSAIKAIYIAPDLPCGKRLRSSRNGLLSRLVTAALGRRPFSSWSITTPFMGRAFEAAGFQVTYIGPLREPYALLSKLKGRFIRSRGWDYVPLAELIILKNYARQLHKLLRNVEGQVILSLGKPHLAFLKTNLPILFFDDASVPSLTKLYPSYTNLYPPVQRDLLAVERQILEKCAYACYMSEWAAEAALTAYGREFEPKIKIVPISANLSSIPTETEIEQAIRSRAQDQCNLLFVGMEWARKGGPIAIAVAEELHRRGIHARLDIMGCPPLASVPSYVQMHGFVPNDTEEGRNLIQRLYRESHFFILPSQAEAYGVAFVEANARGLPVLGCKVGGVSTIVRDGENGWLFPPDAPPAAYADRIQEALRDRETYAALCRSSYRAFQTRLSWKHFGETVYALASQALTESKFGSK